MSVVNSVLLHPLPFAGADRLVMVWERQPGGRPNVVQTQNFLDWRSRNRSFDVMAGLFGLFTNLSGDTDPYKFRACAFRPDSSRYSAPRPCWAARSCPPTTFPARRL